ncbi:hypothetical protein AC630_27720 [Bradyrhizobium sp. AS23.2]|nr:hypothetical protein AC630_27720 [Bradyrhizobium sp. AS23.2]
MIDVLQLCAGDLLKRVRHPFVLQIGANDGSTNDPVRGLIVEHGLPALLIEPHPLAFQKLQQTYQGHSNVKLLNLAIGESDCDDVPFYVPDNELVHSNPRTHRLCSFSREQLLRALTGVGVSHADSRIRAIGIPTKSVNTLLRENNLERVDIIQIDVEGYDWKVLAQFDAKALRTSLINIEFFALPYHEQRQCILRLASNGYKISHFHGDLVAYQTWPGALDSVAPSETISY